MTSVKRMNRTKIITMMKTDLALRKGRREGGILKTYSSRFDCQNDRNVFLKTLLKKQKRINTNWRMSFDVILRQTNFTFTFH